ncbi:hypothetical protein ES703_120662 [subsurface metagenome]
MEIQGIKVDARAIAARIYEMFNNNEQCAVAFGMFPVEKMNILEQQLDKKIEDSAKDSYENALGFRPDHNVAKQDFKKNFVRESMHYITVDIMKYAKSLGKMIA